MARSSLFTKIPLNFLSVIYLLNSLLKARNRPYTTVGSHLRIHVKLKFLINFKLNTNKRIVKPYICIVIKYFNHEQRNSKIFQ